MRLGIIIRKLIGYAVYGFIDANNIVEDFLIFLNHCSSEGSGLAGNP